MLNFYDGQQKIGQNRCLEVPWWRSLEVEQFIFEERLLMVRDYISHVSSLAGSGCTWNYLWSVKLMICHNFWLKIGLDPKLWCWYHLFSPPTLILVPTSRGDVRRGYGCLRFRLSHSFCQGTPSGKGGWQFCVFRTGVEPVTHTVTPAQWVALGRSCDWWRSHTSNATLQ